MQDSNTLQQPQDIKRPLYHTIEETMTTLRISRSTVNRWVNAGKLTKHVIGPNSARITTASIYSLGGAS